MFAVLALLVFCLHASAQQVRAVVLFKGGAMLEIDGARHMLKAGQSAGAVTLVSATARVAVVRLGDREHRLTLSQAISGSYAAPALRELRIPRNDHDQYLTTAEINGHSIDALIDTGANKVAMNSSQARRLGVDLSKGVATRVSTASGTAAATAVLLERVSVGGIDAQWVEAVVIAGSYPEVVLIGTSYLRHVEMQHNAGILLLRQKF
ncbi:MAG: TIGR02281 family clan AA aspartic protease [Spongiibacteraceae bacterium]|jgi:aspartyl protease family protein|nr:TIGR02281 family clan AA aspartic protease [Spongiibacteraceae bacterium]